MAEDSGDDDDRRVERRIPVRFEVDYRADETFLYAQARDLSTMGIFLRTDPPAPIGKIIELRFRAIGREGDLIVNGEVMWRKTDHDGGQPGMGVRFVDVDAITRTRIIDLVEALTLIGPPAKTPPSGIPLDKD
jgi:uncharacterized protein (TIGR02266 family)